METVGAFGAQIVSVGLLLVIVLLPAAAVDWIDKRYGKPYEAGEGGIGCPLQALLYCAMAAALWLALQPAREALAVASCRASDDFAACMDTDSIDLEYDRR